jgi:TonB dependent receptor/Carboxypeptidase regulatory-like domain
MNIITTLSRMRGGLAALGLCCLLAPMAFAQTGAGAIEGRITDADGSALPGVTVTVSNQATGFSRVGTSGAEGGYRFPGVPIGSYDVKFELSGFTTLTQAEVIVNVGSSRAVNVSLQVASVEESITVTTEAPLIRTAPSVERVVSQEELENLPLNGRQFANLAALAPGTGLTVNPDPTKPGQLTVALNGGGGRNINFQIDGGDNTDDTIGGALQNFNLEAVAEFKLQTQQYKAEYGRSSGGVLSVVTKSGTNDLGGVVFGYFRDESLNAKTETERRSGNDKQPFDQKQYGVAVGGPIVRDKAHFFATFERLDRKRNYIVSTEGAFPQFDGTSVPIPFKDDLGTAKVTWDINAKQYLQVRFGYQKNADKYGASPLAAPTSLGTLTNKYSSLLMSHTAQLGGDRLNEALFQYTKFDNAISADSNDPLITYPGGFTTGQNGNTPQATRQTKYQFRDDFTWSTVLRGDRHDFKAGVNYIHEPTLEGDFTTGTAGQFTAAEDRIGSPITLYERFGGFSGQSTPVDQYSVYVQDDWQPSARLTVNVGLRYDYWDGFDLDQRANPIWQVLSTQTQYNESYLRDFQGGKGGVLENDDDNFAPRLGFSWDVKGDGRHLVRGGYGTFFDFPYTNATILFPTGAVQSNYGVVYRVQDDNGIRNPDGSFFQPGQPLPPNQIGGAEVGQPVEIASPTLATPYSDQISLAYSWQATPRFGVNLEGFLIDYHDIPYRFRANPRDPATGRPRFTNIDPFFRLWYGNGRASYDGVNLSGRYRGDRFDIEGFYTYSKAEGNVLAGADEFRLTNANSQADVGGPRTRRDQSINPLNPTCDACFGPLNTDARHRVTVSGLYRAPWGITVGGVFRYRSALPYLEHANADLNGDGTVLDLAPGVTRVNTGRGFDNQQFDLRVAKTFKISAVGIEVLGECFNVFNEKNPALPDRTGKANIFAGDPLQGEQRQFQLGVRLTF